MRRFAGLVAVTALALALASPVLAEYGPLDDPDDPVRALFLYYMAGPEYGRRAVWHPKVNLFDAFLVDRVMEMLAQELEETHRPTAEQRSKLAEALEDELPVHVLLNGDHPDRAIVRVSFPSDDGAQDDPMVFAVALREDEWRILATLTDDAPDPWSAFSILDDTKTDP